MWDIKPRRVLLAVENTECEAAMRFAAGEAETRRCGVHVAHVVPMVLGGTGYLDSLVMINGELHVQGRKVLADVAGHLEHLLADSELPVTTELCHGNVVPALVQESAYSSLVVLQHRGMGSEGHTPVLSVTTGVAARSHCPVVAVPSDWESAPAGPERVVTVGIGEDRDNQHVLEQAAAEAVRRGGMLTVVHAGDLELHDLVPIPPDVPFTFVRSTEAPSDALLAQADHASLFVVGRRHPRHPLARHLGPVARTLLRRSPVPVMVVDPQRDDEAGSGRDLATAAIP
jgi:nucleotide-binding universal stress UspA family protein